MSTSSDTAPVEGAAAPETAGPPEVSVVIPCLNEADTLARCIEKARRAMQTADIAGEIIVADNGSTDGSVEIARSAGARVVRVAERGYGSALMGGIAAATGRYVVMGDGDDSYDFAEIPKFVAKLRDGYGLVQGCRLPSGGGTVAAGAMPFLHRHVGNPVFSLLARWWFGSPLHDVHCGLRGFSKECYGRLDQRCTGMEFATEMIVKASLYGEKMAEVPITLRPDGRKSHGPHLRTFRDGWRHARFFLMYSPRWLFLAPGVLLVLLGLLGFAIALPRMKIAGVVFDVHTLLVASLAILCGYQSIVFAILTKSFAINQGMLPMDKRMERFYQIINLERGLLLGAGAALIGSVMILVAVNQWRQVSFGPLDYSRTMRWVIPGATLAALGVQTVFSSFFASILGMRRK